MTPRRAGVLLHPTSLPGRFGIGDLGPEARRFLDWLREAGQSVWQVLPLGPTSHGDSPYACLSAFAGNAELIAPEGLVEDGLVRPEDLDDAHAPPASRVDRDAVARKRSGPIARAVATFPREAHQELRDAYRRFLEDPVEAAWLEDWCLFVVLKARHHGAAWRDWDPALRLRDPRALERARIDLAEAIEEERLRQFLFQRQWERVRDEAAHRGIRIMGDIPIYVALDSADVWARQELFQLDGEGRPTVVAGVPPDYFSATGQLWGNPIFRWDRMEAEGYRWWIDRILRNARLADLARIDHFRGFASYWAVPAGEATAVHGRWVEGPGLRLFEAIRAAAPRFPIVAEDLGLITPDVRALRERCGFPGMKVLQFGFHEADGEHAPHRCAPDAVAYTGTHDNDTTRGWFESCDDSMRERVIAYTGADPASPHRGMIRALHASAAGLAIVPLQDVLGLGSEHRMNVPGLADGNWGWRALPEQIRSEEAAWLRGVTEATGRLAF